MRPWAGSWSFLCLARPWNRGAALAGGGAPGTCTGAFTEDLNARWCPTCPRPAHNPGEGSAVQAQLWYRDPQSTSNQLTSFSDALELTVCP